MKRLSTLALFALVLLIMTGCGQTGTTTTTTGTSSTIANLSLTATPPSVSSNGVDTTTIEIRALDNNNAAIANEVVTLIASVGALSTSTVTTDINGRATLQFDSGLETANQTAIITATAGGAIDTVNVSIIGTTVSLTTDRSSVGLNGSNTATLSGLVQDGSGGAVAGESVTITSQSGLGILSDGTQSGTSLNLVSDVNGQVVVTYAGGSLAGNDTVILSGSGSSSSVPVTVSGAQFGLADNSGGNDIPLTGNVTFTLSWFDASGVAQSGQTINFATNNGSFSNGFTSINQVTNASGQAVVTLANAVPGGATVTATASLAGVNFSAQGSVTFVSVTPDTIALQVAPSVVAPDLGTGNTPTALLTATVRDVNNLAVANQTVVFALDTGVGGGESISPGIATTNTAGIATTTFNSGGQTSAQDGIIISATLQQDPTISDTTSLTIGAQAARIVFGTSNKISIQTSNGLEIGYALPVTVQVTDNNGNPIASQKVSLGIYPKKFRTGFIPAFIPNPTQGTPPMVENTFGFPTVNATFNNEDADRNGILDSSEDGSTGYPVNGRLDPGNVAAIPASITTDINGFGAFNIVYAKSYGQWVDVELSASTTVSGNQYSASLVVPLAIQEDDMPYLDSPFGL